MTIRGREHLADVGEVLRHWRSIRRISQMEAAHLAHVSPRHLSFIENGHSRASREVLRRLGDALDMPLRERNRLLLATGYAPKYRDALDAVRDPAIRDALAQIVEAAQPFPAIVFDRHWELVALNESAAIFVEGAAEHLLTPPLSTLRLLLHPEGIGHRIEDRGRLAASMLRRLERKLAATGDPVLADLHREFSAYVDPASSLDMSLSPYEPRDIAESFGIRYRSRTLRFISTVATIGTPRDVLASELAIETFYPADAATRNFLAKDDAVAPEHRDVVQTLLGANPEKGLQSQI